MPEIPHALIACRWKSTLEFGVCRQPLQHSPRTRAAWWARSQRLRASWRLWRRRRARGPCIHFVAQLPRRGTWRIQSFREHARWLDHSPGVWQDPSWERYLASCLETEARRWCGFVRERGRRRWRGSWHWSYAESKHLVEVQGCGEH